ncbi:hypothetical protein Aple_026270 [Acrocarpospora pleiomorpha]|uniref:Glycosyl hydrolase family 32 N-terminal domain-containing protein n=1 Tax=Acrocarpospora pleiomorpha TaxID=90975 RepID=A0A5M3XJ78_9ACTN|nr:hypothetical protein [Acrocarpospora pleiomorpha]GES19731.1 hypothetical protein Aple_026270 [Acrocarpospora pleiomorpha]
MSIATARIDLPLRHLNPLDSTVVLTPEADEPGYWIGCASVLHEPLRNRFVLTYRQRRPRGHAGGDRGYRCAVAVSEDGVTFTDVWSVNKRELGSPSMERFSVIAVDGGYQLYISYVDPADNRWRIDLLEAQDVDGFDIASRREVLTAASTGTEGVKDPYVVRRGPVTYLIASYAAGLPTADGATAAHATADIYNVGVTTHPTGLATSVDGREFSWHGEVLGVGDGWDRYQARINSVVALDGGGYLGFYDGSASHQENYEERTGLAVSPDLFTWHRLTPDGPWTVAPHATGSVRYVDAHVIDGEWWIYFETTRPDGAHELRLARRAVSV